MNIRNVIFILSVAVLVMGAGLVLYVFIRPNTQESVLVSSLITTTELVGEVYNNEYMQVTVPSTWKLTEAVQTVNGVATKTGAVNIIRGKYILYINPHAQQASGVTGGRFAEIAQGSPSADAVVTVQPSPPCGKEVVGANVNIPFANLVRKDLYVSSADKKEYCAVPPGGESVWYFSYFTDAQAGYINYYKADESPGYVITMSFNSKDVNALPVKGAPELTATLREMDDIVKTLQLKQWDKITR